MSNIIHFPKAYSISAEDQKILKNQLITEKSPGTILHDFDMMLKLIGTEGVEISSKNFFLSPQSVVKANAETANPIVIGLNNHSQRLYPNINALYLLLRASGLTWIRTFGNKKKLMINTDIYPLWQSLNPCEKYFTLLDTWLVRGNVKLIGEERSGMFAEPLFKWDGLFKSLTSKGLKIAGNKEISETIIFFIGMYVIAMLDMFGFIIVKHGKPESGQGWQIEKIQKTPFGIAMLNLMLETLLPKEDETEDMADFISQIIESEDEPVKELKAVLRPFFPEWQHSLEFKEREFKDGLYVFKVYSDKGTWRKIAIPGKSSLHDLSAAILDAYRFDDEHLYMFIYQNLFGDDIRFCHPYMQEDEISADEVQIGDLQLEVGDFIGFRYDFGDEWRFKIVLESLEPPKSRMKKARIIESQGDAPNQYGYEE